MSVCILVSLWETQVWINHEALNRRQGRLEITMKECNLRIKPSFIFRKIIYKSLTVSTPF